MCGAFFIAFALNALAIKDNNDRCHWPPLWPHYLWPVGRLRNVQCVCDSELSGQKIIDPLVRSIATNVQMFYVYVLATFSACGRVGRAVSESNGPLLVSRSVGRSANLSICQSVSGAPRVSLRYFIYVIASLCSVAQRATLIATLMVLVCGWQARLEASSSVRAVHALSRPTSDNGLRHRVVARTLFGGSCWQRVSGEGS